MELEASVRELHDEIEKMEIERDEMFKSDNTGGRDFETYKTLNRT